MLAYHSENTVSVTVNDVVTVFDSWVVSDVWVGLKPDGAVSLNVTFTLTNDAKDMSPIPPVVVSINDLLTDLDVAAASASFFQALVAKAVGQGLIS